MAGRKLKREVSACEAALQALLEKDPEFFSRLNEELCPGEDGLCRGPECKGRVVQQLEGGLVCEKCGRDYFEINPERYSIQEGAEEFWSKVLHTPHDI